MRFNLVLRRTYQQDWPQGSIMNKRIGFALVIAILTFGIAWISLSWMMAGLAQAGSATRAEPAFATEYSAT